MSFFGGNLIWNVASQAVASITGQDDVAIVYSVILDENHPLIKSGESTIADVGAIQCRLLKDIQNDRLLIARPLDSTVTILPIRNQSVFIQKLGNGYVYTQMSNGLSPNARIGDQSISTLFDPTQEVDGGSKSKGYASVSSTGIARSNSSQSTDFDGYGDYFTAEEGIHKLKLYEGDVLFQSRFGQSIRLSGYNNSENVFSPTLILRNGESPENRKLPENSLAEENVNDDGNIIFLGSGEKLLEYTLPTTNSRESFSNYPSELKGNQILLNSDRIILSAKAAEMIFSAKKDVGFITDGLFSIDSTKGIDVTLDGDTNYKTNDRNINLNTGNGKVNIGDANLESLVRGETLVNLMTELISAIEVMTHITPSGLSAPPLNVASFTKVKSSLKTMLSNLNKTS